MPLERLPRQGLRATNKECTRARVGHGGARGADRQPRLRAGLHAGAGSTRVPGDRRFLREFTDTQIGAFETALHQRLGEGADRVHVSSLAAATGAVLSRMTRLVVERDLNADPAAPDVLRRQHDTLRRALELMFAGFEESGAEPASQES